MTASRLRRNITVALVVKLVLLTGIYVMFFRGDQRPMIDASIAARHILSPEARP